MQRLLTKTGLQPSTCHSETFGRRAHQTQQKGYSPKGARADEHKHEAAHPGTGAGNASHAPGTKPNTPQAHTHTQKQATRQTQRNKPNKAQEAGRATAQETYRRPRRPAVQDHRPSRPKPRLVLVKRHPRRGVPASWDCSVVADDFFREPAGSFWYNSAA